MAHISEHELAQKLAAAARQVKAGGRYQHYKGRYYRVLNLVINEADEAVGVVYQDQYGDQLKFVRPLSEWLETVALDGRQVPRFELIK